jgi:hypothetical protein
VEDQRSDTEFKHPVLDDPFFAEGARKRLRELEKVIAEDARDYAAEGGNGKWLITVDELRAAGALNVPAAWRKSLRVDRDLSPGLFDDEGSHPKEEKPTPRDPDDDESEDELL